MSLKDVKRNFLVETATQLFLSKGIDNVTIKDIADEAGVGEMTIYRYFKKKTNIVAESVMLLQQTVLVNYFKLDNGKTGFEKLSIFYNSYLGVFKDRPDFFRFIREFDLLMREEETNSLQAYESGLSVFKNQYFEAYELGLKDGSVKKIDNLELFYFTSTHALIELCKKLSYERVVLSQDEKINKVDEINCLINAFLTMVKNS